jgi:hypothetical protein
LGRAKSTTPNATGHQPAQDEQRAGASGLPALERGEDLEEAAHERPDPHDQHQHQRRGPRPHQGDYPGREVDQPEQQVPEDRSRGATAERARSLQPRVGERVDREQDDQREDRYPGPREGDDPDDDGEDAEKNQ